MKYLVVLACFFGIVGCSEVSIDADRADRAVDAVRDVKSKADQGLTALTGPAKDFLAKATALGDEAKQLAVEAERAKAATQSVRNFVDRNLASPAKEAQAQAYGLLEQIAKISPDQREWATQKVKDKAAASVGEAKEVWDQLLARIERTR